jgi:putative tryptophan/tyrosine transport system substrate-binding protein
MREDSTMRRSPVALIVIVALAILVASLAAMAQLAGKVLKIGLLMPGSATTNPRGVEAFTRSLRELGYIEGQHIAIEQRYAEGSAERLPALAAELANLPVDVFVVTINRVAEAVQQTTTQIPIVMIAAEEPVASGLAKSLAHPGGAITGVAVVPGADIYGKNLELLTEVLPPGVRIGVLFNPTSAVNALWLQATEEAARGVGVTLVPAGVRSVEDFEQALAVMQQGCRSHIDVGTLRHAAADCPVMCVSRLTGHRHSGIRVFSHAPPTPEGSPHASIAEPCLLVQ